MKSIVIASTLILGLSSCASIVSRTSYDVRVNSLPAQATVNIFNRNGVEVFTGTTPCQVSLKAAHGYFQRAIYTMEFNKEGYARKTIVVQAGINEWYFGNILFGGWIGMLFVDPLTGAMYKLRDTDIQQSLTPLSVKVHAPERALLIYNLADISPSWKNKMELLLVK